MVDAQRSQNFAQSDVNAACVAEQYLLLLPNPVLAQKPTWEHQSQLADVLCK
jgi:hypothetical protein